MADPEQFALLKADVEVWNKWREDNSITRIDLRGANFGGLNLSGANLSGANLHATQALKTNFESAILTGACIQDWNINSQTNLNNVICNYLYLRYNENLEYLERRPHDSDKTFAPGEFTKLFQKALETVDLIFIDGINWEAFLASFKKLQKECGGGEDLKIKTIEDKDDGTLAIRVNVPPDANKVEIEKYIATAKAVRSLCEAQPEQDQGLFSVYGLTALAGAI